ncbi:MAG: hypothetical protein R6T93_10655 [Trueperaceae bacterium]
MPRAPGPAPAAPEPATDAPEPFDEGAQPDPFAEGPPPDPFDEGAQPDPFAEATPERPDSASEPASVTSRRPPEARASAEALAEAAAGDRLELLRSVFPGRVLRLVPPAAPGGSGGRPPALDDAEAVPLEAPSDADGVDTDPNEPGGSA